MSHFSISYNEYLKSEFQEEPKAKRITSDTKICTKKNQHHRKYCSLHMCLILFSTFRFIRSWDNLEKHS